MPFKAIYSLTPEKFNGQQKPRDKENEVKIKGWKKRRKTKSK